MKIFVMRHGEAELFSSSDASRRLTSAGKDNCKSVAEALHKKNIDFFDKVIVSPYIRAQQTWESMSNIFAVESIVTDDSFTPSGDALFCCDYLKALIEQDDLSHILVVSHLPLVGYLTAHLVSDLAPPMFPTSGVFCIDYDRSSQRAELLWQIFPNDLK